MACCSAAITGPTVRAAKARPSSVRVTSLPLCAPFPGQSSTRPFFTMAATAEFSVCLGCPHSAAIRFWVCGSCVVHSAYSTQNAASDKPHRCAAAWYRALHSLNWRFVISSRSYTCRCFSCIGCLFSKSDFGYYYSPISDFCQSPKNSCAFLHRFFPLPPCKSGPPLL